MAGKRDNFDLPTTSSNPCALQIPSLWKLPPPHALLDLLDMTEFEVHQDTKRTCWASPLAVADGVPVCCRVEGLGRPLGLTNRHRDGAGLARQLRQLHNQPVKPVTGKGSIGLIDAVKAFATRPPKLPKGRATHRATRMAAKSGETKPACIGFHWEPDGEDYEY